MIIHSMAGPSIYTPELAAAICARLAAGETLRSICRDPEMPNRSTVADWVIADRDGFANRYARARDIGLDEEADEIKEIADTYKLGQKIERKEISRVCSLCHKGIFWAGLEWRHGNQICAEGPMCEGANAEREYEERTIEGDMVERAKLQIDARKWRLSKMAHKRYGDRLTMAGDPDAPLVPPKITVELVEAPPDRPTSE